jgi:hypothetical protein
MEIHSKECAYCGKIATRKVNGKNVPTVWCNIECQNKWIDSFKECQKEEEKNK